MAFTQTTSTVAKDVASLEPSSSSGPPATATRHATESAPPAESTESESSRESSEDQEDVSFQVPPVSSSEPGSSPVPRQAGRTPASKIPLKASDSGGDDVVNTSPSPGKSAIVRAKRVIRPPPAPQMQRRRQPGLVVPSIAPDMSEKELKATTHHNTIRNQVYLCAIDRQIVRKTGPRPPSPTSKIRTTADRVEAEMKAGREARAKRRSRGSDVDTDVESEEDVYVSVVERSSHVRRPGDEEDYETPARPAKKAKMSHTQSQGVAKSVKWDKGLVVIRHREGEVSSRPLSRISSTDDGTLSKSCLRDETKVCRKLTLIHPGRADGSRLSWISMGTSSNRNDRKKS